MCVHFKVVFLVVPLALLRFKALSPQEAHCCLENMYKNVFFAEHSAWGPLRTYMEIEPCLGIWVFGLVKREKRCSDCYGI